LLLPYYFEVPVDEPVLDPMLPDGVLLGLAEVSLDVLPEALEPYWRRHWSRSSPVFPTHWLGAVELLPAAAPVSELVLDPVLGLALGLVVELGELVDSLLAPTPLDVLPDCAHDAPATATNAAATAVAIVLTITIKSPWSVEEDCRRGVARGMPAALVSGWRITCRKSLASHACRTVLTTC